MTASVFNRIMRGGILTFCMFSYTIGVAQPNCTIGYVDGSRTITYDQAAVDEILHLSNYSAIFMGESHTLDFEPEFKYHFIRHLHEKYAVKDVIMEIGHSAAYFFNRFLQTGDTALLTNYRLPYLWGHYPEFWTKLYQYNRELPDSIKLTIHGIDFERTEVFKLLAEKSDAPIPEFLSELFKRIDQLSKKTSLFFMDKEFQSEFFHIKLAFQTHRDDFKRIYGARFPVVDRALTNPVTVTTGVTPRNKGWLLNLKAILKNNDITKIVAFIGAAHARLNNTSSLPVSLPTNGFFSGKILTISTIYHHFISAGGSAQVIEFGYKEEELFNTFYDPKCRGNFVRASEIPKTTFKTEADFVLFAREIPEP